MKVVVGLGNPGVRYARTRHNIGFEVVDELAKALGALPWGKKYRAKVAEATGVVLAKPQTYMNSSGDSVHEICSALAIPASDVIVVLDDMDLPLGKVRIRQKGSSAGHKGMQSIIDRLGTSDIPRVKVGIGRPEEGVDPVDYVLGRPSAKEREVLLEAIRLARDACLTIIEQGLERAMNKFNSSPNG